MDDTEQFNLRLSKTLMADLDFIAKRKGIQKTEWVRYNLAELIKIHKNHLKSDLDREFVLEQVGQATYQELIGHPPDKSLIEKRSYLSEKISDVLTNGLHADFARKALLAGAPKTETRNNKEDRIRVYAEKK